MTSNTWSCCSGTLQTVTSTDTYNIVTFYKVPEKQGHVYLVGLYYPIKVWTFKCVLLIFSDWNTRKYKESFQSELYKYLFLLFSKLFENGSFLIIIWHLKKNNKAKWTISMVFFFYLIAFFFIKSSVNRPVQSKFRML